MLARNFGIFFDISYCHNQHLVSFTTKCLLISFTDPEDVLSVSIPLEGPQSPLLGGTLVLPCYFEVCSYELSLHVS